ANDIVGIRFAVSGRLRTPQVGEYVFVRQDHADSRETDRTIGGLQPLTVPRYGARGEDQQRQNDTETGFHSVSGLRMPGFTRSSTIQAGTTSAATFNTVR